MRTFSARKKGRDFAVKKGRDFAVDKGIVFSSVNSSLTLSKVEERVGGGGEELEEGGGGERGKKEEKNKQKEEKDDESDEEEGEVLSLCAHRYMYSTVERRSLVCPRHNMWRICA